MSWFFKRALRKETSINSVNYLNNSYLFELFVFFILMTMIYMNALFKEANDGFTVKGKKKLYISAERS